MDKSDESGSKKTKEDDEKEEIHAEVAEEVTEDVAEDLTDVSIMPATKGSSDISPITPMHDELYVILFEDGNTFIGKVTEIHELDRIVRLTSDGGETIDLLIDENGLVLQGPKYKILDIQRVLIYDLKLLDEEKDEELIETMVDIDVDDVQEKDMVFTEIEKRESLLSDLIYCYQAYDKYYLVKFINDTVDTFLDLLTFKDDEKYTYNLHKNKTFPKWLVPVIDNPINLYSSPHFSMLDMETASKDYNYLDIIRKVLESGRSIDPSVSDVGVNTHTHHGIVYRDCIQDTSCLGVQGNYSYDKRKNSKPLTIPTIDDEKMTVHQSDTMKIVGLLYIPDENISQAFSIGTTNQNINLFEKCILQGLIDACLRKTSLKDVGLLNKSLTSDIVLSDLNNVILYNLEHNMNYDEFYELATHCIPSIEELLNFLDDDIKNKLLNYRDIRKLYIKYDIEPDKLSQEDKLNLNKLLESNVEEYLTNIRKLPKIFLKEKHQVLSIETKISISKDIIMKMSDIPKRNDYLQRFIELFSRNPIDTEDKGWLYNNYNDEKLMCKHYTLISTYNKNPEAFDILKNGFAKAPPIDGNVYCKVCGEYLFDEEFSTSEGFNDDQPTVMREAMVDDTDILADFKDEDVELVKKISQAVGVSIETDDIHEALVTYSNFDPNIIANIRYGTLDVINSDEHPRISGLADKYKKDKKKKELIKKEKTKFAMFLRNTNLVIFMISILLIVIQTAIPRYNTKHNLDFNLLEITDTNYNNPDRIELNTKIIDYFHMKVKKLSNSYLSEELWFHYKELSDENKHFDVVSVKSQIINCIKMIVSPRCPSIIQRIHEYYKFVKGVTGKYVRDEWPIFKPLRDNKMIKDVDEFINETIGGDFKHFILNYNNHPVENICLLSGLTESSDKLIHELLKIPTSEIMMNKAFITLFRLCVANYGSSDSEIPIVDLHIERFLETISDKDEMIAIFEKHKWKSSKEAGKLSYNNLRTNIIPEIIGHYHGKSQGIEACYSDSEACNRFIHININNYDLSLLNVNTKRIYKHSVPTVWPENDYDDISDNIKELLSQSYCKDPAGNIIKRYLGTEYLWNLLLNISAILNIN